MTPTTHDFQKFLVDAWEEGRLELHEDLEDDDCPQGDTCGCPRVAEFERLCKGYVES